MVSHLRPPSLHRKEQGGWYFLCPKIPTLSQVPSATDPTFTCIWGTILLLHAVVLEAPILGEYTSLGKIELFRSGTTQDLQLAFEQL